MQRNFKRTFADVVMTRLEHLEFSSWNVAENDFQLPTLGMFIFGDISKIYKQPYPKNKMWVKY